MLLIEGMAQTAGALCIRAHSADQPVPLVYFMSIDKAKFRKPVVPGDRVEFHMTKINRRRNMWWYSGRAMVDGAIVCEAQIAAMIVEEEPVKTSPQAVSEAHLTNEPRAEDEELLATRNM